MSTSHDIQVINGLITTTIDSADGYRKAAEDATNEQFRSMFSNWANERDAVVDDLQLHVRTIGGEPDTTGSLLAGAHRFMLDVRDALSTSDDTAVIAEVERGEDYIKDKYETALNDEDLSAMCREKVSMAYQSVRKGHDQMSSLKSGMENGTGSAPQGY